MGHLNARSGKYRYVNSEMYQEMPFCIDMAGVDRCTPNYYLERKHSPISVMGYVRKGGGIITQNDQTVKAEEGSLFLLNCRDSHVYYPVGEWEFYWVNTNSTVKSVALECGFGGQKYPEALHQ